MAVTEYRSIHGPRLGLGATGEIVVDGNVLDVTDPIKSSDVASAPIAAITTAGGTALAADTLQNMLKAIADLADPAA